jgi:hypothetical protein
MMSNGRHFNPPTPAYRPRDPFASVAPKLAEFIPSSESTKPPPNRVRPVRVDSTSPLKFAMPGSLGSGTAVPALARGEELPKADEKEAPPPAGQEAAPEAATPEPAPAAAEAQAPEAIKEPAKKKRKGKEAKEPEPPVAEAKGKARPVKKAKAPAAPAKRAQPVEAEPADPPDQDQLVVGDDEEIRICEWEKCGKQFVIKRTGRNTVRRFCSGTCRGRASEARTGKR